MSQERGVDLLSRTRRSQRRDFNPESSVICLILWRCSLSGVEEEVGHGEDGIHRSECGTVYRTGGLLEQGQGRGWACVGDG